MTLGFSIEGGMGLKCYMSLDVGGELGLGEDEGLGLGEGGEFGLGLEEELEPARLFSRLNSSGLFFKYSTTCFISGVTRITGFFLLYTV